MAWMWRIVIGGMSVGLLVLILAGCQTGPAAPSAPSFIQAEHDRLIRPVPVYGELIIAKTAADGQQEK